jgi:hypothetical protein
MLCFAFITGTRLPDWLDYDSERLATCLVFGLPPHQGQTSHNPPGHGVLD